MRRLRIWLAENGRTSVALSLGELEQLMDALAGTAEDDRRRRKPAPDDRPLIRKIERARRRRLRAVDRAYGA